MTEFRGLETADDRRDRSVQSSVAVALGCALTLSIRGYQFGHSNHTIYLLDALRVNDPRILVNDWFATHTLQYHVVFTRLTAALDRLGALRPAFLGAYLALVELLHVGWLRIVRAVGGGWREYLLSVVLFSLSAGGMGLGMYEFMQDGALLPSNVANVAMLWGLYFWITGRPAAAGATLGVAGFFHLNHAVLGLAMWAALLPWSPSRQPRRAWVLGTLLLVALVLPNVIPAARAAVGGHGGVGLQEFVDLYVRLRHPHHYGPSTWPAALWASFLWPFPLAIVAFRRAEQTSAVREIRKIFLFFAAVLVLALAFAGVWYVSETLVQMSLFRFSIYPKLLSCVGAAMLMAKAGRPAISLVALSVVAAAFALRFLAAERLPAVVADNARTILFTLLLLICCATLELVAGLRRAVAVSILALPLLACGATFAASRIWDYHLIGLRVPVGAEEAPAYLRLCDYAREHTPPGAIFVVPPGEEAFRLTARRAIVANFKGVPQLASELPEWRDRLCAVLDVPTLAELPRGRFDRTLAWIGERYDRVPADHLLAAAHRYGARYLVATHELDLPPPARLAFESGRYRLYDLAP